MFCPKCESEYRPGFDRCVDCDLPLVDSLPSKGPQDDESLVLAFFAAEASDLRHVTSILDATEIPYVIEQEQTPFSSGGAVAHVLVPQERYEDAVILLEKRSQSNLQPSEQEGKFQDVLTPPRSNSFAQGAGYFDLHRFARFIILGGLVVLGFGALKFLANLPVSYASSGGSYLIEMGRQMDISDANLVRGSKREEAITWLIGGAIVTFLGFAVSASTADRRDSQLGYRGQGGGNPSQRKGN